jgi:hypothetical protein
LSPGFFSHRLKIRFAMLESSLALRIAIIKLDASRAVSLARRMRCWQSTQLSSVYVFDTDLIYECSQTFTSAHNIRCHCCTHHAKARKKEVLIPTEKCGMENAEMFANGLTAFESEHEPFRCPAPAGTLALHRLCNFQNHFPKVFSFG